MAQDSDYIVFQPQSPSVSGTSRTGETTSAPARPGSEGEWQRDALSVLQMYRQPFSPVA